MTISLLDVEALLPSWELSLRAERKSPATIRTYGEGVRAWLRWCATTGTAPDLTRATAQAYIAAVIDGGAQGSTALTRLKGLKMFSRWLVAEGELDTDPLAGMRSPKLDQKVIRALSAEQLDRLIKACAGKDFLDRRDEAVLRVMIETGARASEVIDLRVADVDLRRGTVTITRGKGGKGRVVPIGAQTGVALDRYLRMRRSTGRGDTGPLWLGKRGALGYFGLQGLLERRASAAGLEGVHLHLLRHTFATRWKAAHGTDDGLMAIAGWSTRAMIDRYTGAAAAERAADEARRLALGEI